MWNHFIEKLVINKVLKLTTLFSILNKSLNDVLRMHDYNYQLQKYTFNEYWDEEVFLYPTLSMNSSRFPLTIS